MNPKIHLSLPPVLAGLLLCIVPAFAADGSPDDRIRSLLQEAAVLAQAQDGTGAALKAAEAAAVPDASPEAVAQANNASLNYYARRSASTTAEKKRIRLNALFSDHAVLQRETPIPVWGHVEPGRFVTVGFRSHYLTTKANENGAFMLYLPAQEAGGPYTMTVLSDGETVTCTNLYVGEVWIAGGQSNMEMPLTGYGAPVPREDYAALQSKRPVRMLKVAQNNEFTRNEDSHASWMTTWEGHEKIWSATGAFFAFFLAEKLDVPVGIVLCSYSGSKAEAWMSFGAINKVPGLRKALEKHEFTDRSTMLTDDNKPAFSSKYGPAAPAYSRILRDIDDNYDILQTSGGREKIDHDDATWQKLTVPGDWRDTITRANGIVWYRKTVQIPEAWAGKDLMLSLGAIDKQDVTYFNGVQVGATGKGLEHIHWGTLRSYPVPAALVKAGPAVIAVRAFSFADGSGMYGPAQAMTLSCPSVKSEALPLAGEWLAQMSLNIGEREGASRAYRHFPHMLSDSMLNTVIPYAARGAIWYQGESNAANRDYDEIMIGLIRDWQARWNQGEFAFLQVLLAGWSNAATWPEIRLKQIAAAEATGTGFASATDLGHANIHPPYKRAVGERLALRALTDVYGRKDIVSRGPELETAAREGNQVKVTFRYAEGLTAKSGKPAGFEAAGPDNTFVPAEARIEGVAVIVSLPADLKEPVTLRYAWKDFPVDANLYNQAGLPAIPFQIKLK